MELIYGWINKFRNFENEEIHFGDQFDIHFDSNNNKLSIGKNKDYISMSSNVTNILSFNAVVGRNGAGKTNLLDLIGSRFADRQLFNPENKYFLLYYSTKKKQFVLEGNHFDVLDNIRENQKIDKGYFKGKGWYALELKFENNELSFLWDYCDHDDKTYIISLREKYEGNNYGRNSLEERDESKIMIQRRLTEDIPRSLIPKINMLIHQLQEQGRELFREKRYLLKITYNDFFVEYYKEDIKFQGVLKSYSTKNSKVIEAFVLEYFRRAILYKGISEEVEIKLFKRIFVEGNVDIDFKEYYWNFVESINNKILNGIIDSRSKEYNEKQYLKFIAALEVHHGFDYYSEGDTNSDQDGYLQLEITKDMKLESYKDLIAATVDSDRYAEEQEVANLFQKFFNNTLTYLSNGEQTYLGIFSTLYEQLLNIVPDAQHYIVLLDEPDRNMHPELARNFIHNLNIFIQDSFKDTNKTFQFIISTHSPFILTDVISERIATLKRKGNKSTNIVRQEGKSFGGNIQKLLIDDFFMDSTIGEYATKEIKRVITLLNSEKELSNEEKNECEYIIQKIGEPMIQNRLKKMYGDRVNIIFPEGDRDKVKSGIVVKEYEEMSSIIFRQIEELQKIQKSLGRLKR